MENKIQKILDKYSDVSLDPKQLENKEEELIPLLFSKVSQMPELVLKSSETLNENACLPNNILNENFPLKENVQPKILYSVSKDDPSSPPEIPNPESESIQEQLKSIIKSKKFINYSPKTENTSREWCIIDEGYNGPFTDEEILKKLEEYHEDKNKDKKGFILFDKKNNEYMTIDTCYDLLKNKLDPKNNNISNKNKTDFDLIRQNINQNIYNRNLLYLTNVNNMYARMNNEIKRRYFMNQMNPAMNPLLNKQLFMQNLPLGMSMLNEMYIKQKQFNNNNNKSNNNVNKDNDKNGKAKNNNEEKNDVNKNYNNKNNYKQNNNNNNRNNHSYNKQNKHNNTKNNNNYKNENYNKNNNNKNNYNNYNNYNTKNYNNNYLNKNQNFNNNNNYNNNYNKYGNNYNNNYYHNNYNNNNNYYNNKNNYRDNKGNNKYNKSNYEDNTKNDQKNNNKIMKEAGIRPNETEDLLNELFSSDEKKTETKKEENEMKFVKVDIDKLFS